MIRRRHSRRLDPAWAVALVAICCSLSGTAWAASKVLYSGADVVDRSLRSADVADNGKGLRGADLRDGSLTAADFSAAARAQLDQVDPQATIPAGRTVTGVVGSRQPVNPDILTAVVLPVMLPAPTTVQLNSSNVNTGPDIAAATTDDDPECTGTSLHPTAPPGKVCIYPHFLPLYVRNISGSGLAFGSTVDGFALSLEFNGETTDPAMYFSWAFTQP